MRFKNMDRENRIWIYAIFIILILLICIPVFYFQHQINTNFQNTNRKWMKLFDLGNIDYDYFINAAEWHYNQKIEKLAACAVENYSKQAGIEEEKWELTHMYSENDIISVFVRSKKYRELFLLLKDDMWLLIADIQRGDDLEIKLMNNEWSYRSEFEWNSYEQAFEKGVVHYQIKSGDKYYQYDSIYDHQARCALETYLIAAHANENIEWEIMYERFFIASSGCLVDVWYTDGENEVHMVLDINNKMYTVIDVT